MPYDTKAGFDQWLLIRRSASEPENLAYYRIFGPAATRLQDIARLAATRWVSGEGFECAKEEVGLDQYEFRRGEARHRNITLSSLAQADPDEQRGAVAT